MTMPADKARLLEEIVAALTGVPKLETVALGGSHARGTHTPRSDLDIGLHYREADPFAIADIRDIAERFSVGGPPTVTEFYGWGPFVNGGAWIVNPVCKVDFLYRNLDQLDGTIAAARRGEWQHSFDQHPPFGFRSVTMLGEIHCARPVFDPKNVLGPLKDAVAIFPSALKTRIIQDTLGCAEFAFVHAREFAKSGDIPNTVACMTRIYHYLIQALFALNEVYFMNDKRVMAEIETFAQKPAGFAEWVSAILASAGATTEALLAALNILDSVFTDTVALAEGNYVRRFNPPLQR